MFFEIYLRIFSAVYSRRCVSLTLM